MKLYLVPKLSWRNMTKGVKYEIIAESEGMYAVIDNFCKVHWVSKTFKGFKVV